MQIRTTGLKPTPLADLNKTEQLQTNPQEVATNTSSVQPTVNKTLTNPPDSMKFELERVNQSNGKREITPLTILEARETVRNMVKSAKVHATFEEAHRAEVGSARVAVEAGTTVTVDAELFDSKEIEVTFSKPLKITRGRDTVLVHSIKYDRQTGKVDAKVDHWWPWADQDVERELEKLLPQGDNLNLESIENLLGSLGLGGEKGLSKLSTPSFEVTLKAPPQGIKITTDDAVLRIPKYSLSYISGSYSGTIADPKLEQVRWEFRGNFNPTIQAREGAQGLVAFDMDEIVIDKNGQAGFRYSSLSDARRQNVGIVNSKLANRYHSLRALVEESLKENESLHGLLRETLKAEPGDLLPWLGMAE